KIFPVLALGSLLVSTGFSWAETPDGQTPSEETVCDSQRGAAYGLCTAYCEAMDCDSPAPQASPTACSRVRGNYERITGLPLPCEATCPCNALPLFRDFVNGTAQAATCQEDSSFTTLVTPEDDFVIVDSGTAPPTCSANFETPIAITAAEAFVCRQLLRAAAAAQGLACVAPE
ncbi:MAG TPA: hypothetical protein VIW92_09660, partial [Thermoanaerobaculia bacterium]